MPERKKKHRRAKRVKKIKKKQSVRVTPQIKPKSEKKDTYPQKQPQMPRSNGIVFKVKMKKK